MTKVSRRALLVILVAAAIPLIGVAVTRIFLQIPISAMTRDVNAIAGIHPLVGILSSLGILLWWTSASVYLFAAYLLRDVPGATGGGFMVYSGLLSFYLGLDDLFQIHEKLAPRYLKVPELGGYALLGLATVFYLWRYRHVLRRADTVLLMLALALLAASVAVDAVLEPWLRRLKDWEYFVEDGAKWLGICFWTSFCVVRCASDLESVLPQAPRKTRLP
jgi:hypothetical protein